ncbi:MAG: phosphatase PAP2 family protein [Polaromonas sp.]|nr:phosphatase PAP2 family protein [Polaromonas sp.]
MAGFLLLLLWDLSGLDLTVARWFGSLNGFALQSHWFWEGVLHGGVKRVQWLPAGLLIAMVVLPLGFMRKLALPQRLQLAGGTLLALALISGLKLGSGTSCPWDLQEFGGAALKVSHWHWGTADGGGGHCFPAGHASAGFAYLSGYFVFRRIDPRVARWWLIGALAAGLALGLAQQLRGAHFMSHTLWTAWLCWLVGALLDAAVSRRRQQTCAPAPTPASGFAAPAPLTPPA